MKFRMKIREGINSHKLNKIYFGGKYSLSCFLLPPYIIEVKHEEIIYY